jgi:hypothetical protein
MVKATVFHYDDICEVWDHFEVAYSLPIILVSVLYKIASCRELFKKFNILPLTSEFLFSLLSYVVDNVEKFQTD